LPGLALSPFALAGEAAQFDLELGMGVEDGRVGGVLKIATDLFDGTTAVRWLGHFEALMAAAFDEPDRRAGDLPLLRPAERHHLLVEWNASGLAVPAEQRAHELIFERAGRTPAAIAVVAAGAAAEPGGELTYGELAARARAAAGRLAARGVRPGTVVAVLADRGLDFLSGILGVFAAGGAYLPLDPLHPAPRLAQVLERSETPLVLVSPAYESALDGALAMLPSAARPEVADLASLFAGEEEPAASARATLERPGANDLAYAIFTSGSTGVPKGALVEHRGMLNHLCAKIADLSLSAGDAIAQTASQSFDISVWQFLAALLVGGRVEIFDDATAHDPARLLPEVARRGVTILETVPSI